MRRRCSSLNTIAWSVHSCRADPIKRSTRPFCQGERKDVGRSLFKEQGIFTRDTSILQFEQPQLETVARRACPARPRSPLSPRFPSGNGAPLPSPPPPLRAPAPPPRAHPPPPACGQPPPPPAAPHPTT